MTWCDDDADVEKVVSRSGCAQKASDGVAVEGVKGAAEFTAFRTSW